MLKQSQSGYTILELLLVIVLLGILTGVAVWPLADLRNKSRLEAGAEQVVEVLQQARSQTLAAVNRTGYGVYFTETEMVLFPGDFYNPDNLDNKIFNLSSGLIMEPDFLGGDEVFFSRLTGRANPPGEVLIFLESNSERFVSVEVSGSGVIKR